jgi:hypothetical protein
VSAVIVAVIVVMWAVVLVPMWLRRHDAATEMRSADKFSSAMRVLSRRNNSGSPDRRYVLMPRRDDGVSVHVSGAASARATATRAAKAAQAQARRSRAAVHSGRKRAPLAVRRRRVLVGLLGLAALTFLLVVTGVLGWKLQLVVDLVLGGFVVHLRSQAKRAAAVTRQRRRATVAPTVTAAATPAAGRHPAVAEPVVAADAEGVPESDQATGTEGAAGWWEPVPVPRPTYTMKPAAPSRPATARADTAAGPAYEQEPEPAYGEQVAQEAAEPSELDEILERRWAVND